MASMQYRYSRGQAGQSSLPRPAWGSGGSHGTRATSPEPGGLGGSGIAGTPLGNGGDVPKERLAGGPHDEVILQLENELVELRNACAWKDQRIAELSRTDTPVVRLKKDIRLLASELHHARKQLSEREAEIQAGSTAATLPRDAVETTSGGGIVAQLRERLAEVQEENRQLREAMKNLESMHLGHQPSGGSTQRSVEAMQQQHQQGGANAQMAGNYRNDPAMGRAPYLSGPFGQPGAGGRPAAGAAPSAGSSGPAAGVQAAPQQEEPLRQIVYSTVHTENTATIGPTTLQGVGTVDGVASVAKILLQRIHSSVCAQHRRPVGAAMMAPGQPMQPGQIPMVVVGMPQGM